MEEVPTLATLSCENLVHISIVRALRSEIQELGTLNNRLQGFEWLDGHHKVDPAA